MSFDLLVFDLDGTLIDSKLDLALAVNATRADAGLGDLPHEEIYRYVGNGAPMLIRRALGPEASDEQAERSLHFFYAYYREHMLDNTALYPGVRQSLDQWRSEGKALAILTNKPVRFSRDIVAGLGLGGHFRQIYGGNSFESKKPDPYGLQLVMDENGVPAGRTLMVGDSGVDVQTARNAGAASAGVTYGLQPETFEEHPPDFLVDRMEDLLAVTRNGHGRRAAPILSHT